MEHTAAGTALCVYLGGEFLIEVHQKTEKRWQQERNMAHLGGL